MMYRYAFRLIYIILFPCSWRSACQRFREHLVPKQLVESGSGHLLAPRFQGTKVFRRVLTHTTATQQPPGHPHGPNSQTLYDVYVPRLIRLWPFFPEIPMPRKHKQTNAWWKMRKITVAFCWGYYLNFSKFLCNCPMLRFCWRKLSDPMRQGALWAEQAASGRAHQSKGMAYGYAWPCMGEHIDKTESPELAQYDWNQLARSQSTDLLNLAGGSGGVESRRAFLTFTHAQRWTQSTSRGKGQFWDALCVCHCTRDGESVPVKIAENTVESGGDVLQEMWQVGLEELDQNIWSELFLDLQWLETR